MVFLKSRSDIEKIREAGKIVAETLALIKRMAVPGVTTWELDQAAEKLINSFPDCLPAFKGYGGFPGTLCTSVNEQVVHGIPSSGRVLKDGDLLSIDVGVVRKSFYADAAASYMIGPSDERCKKLLDCTVRALAAGIAKAIPGNRVGDIGHAVDSIAKKNNYSVVRDLVGHGIGQNLHEDPQVPNYGKPGRGCQLKEGLVIAIEPMVNEGTHEIRTLNDSWTVVTADGKLSAHMEHTVALGANGPEILTN